MKIQSYFGTTKGVTNGYYYDEYLFQYQIIGLPKYTYIFVKKIIVNNDDIDITVHNITPCIKGRWPVFLI